MIRILGESSIAVTGLEGSGKSHFIMSQVKEILDTRKTTQVFLANVDGVTIVHPNFHLVGPDFDWRDAPPDSVVIYDESGTIKRFNNSSTKIDSDPQVASITMRRHKDITLVFVAQDSKLLHSGLRQLLKYQYHFSNPYSSSTETRCFKFAGVRSNLSNDNKTWKNDVVEEFTHKLDPKIFPLYKSVDEGVKHNKKKVVNKKARLMFIGAGVSALIAIPLFIFMITAMVKWKKEHLNADKVNAEVNHKTVASTATATVQNGVNSLKPASSVNSTGQVQLAQANLDAKRELELYKERLPEDYRILANNSDLRVGGVMSIGGRCRAYNQYGDLLSITQNECKHYLKEKGLMISAQHAGVNTITENPTASTDQNNQSIPQKMGDQPKVESKPIDTTKS